MKRNPLSIVMAALMTIFVFMAQAAYGDAGIPAVVGLSWTPDHTAPGNSVQIRLDIGNPGTNSNLTDVAFDVTLPAGLSVGNIAPTPIGCGTVSATAPNTIHYTNGTIAANTPVLNSACNVQLNITTSTEGVFTATSTQVTSNEGGTGLAASAMLTVGSPPTITKYFGSPTGVIGQSVSLTFDINNPNALLATTGVGFTDTLPAGLVVASPNNLSNTCSGSVTATAGAGSVQLSGASLAAMGSCSVAVDVVPTTAGTKNNSVQVTSNLGNGNTSNTSITALAPPSISKVFGAASIPLNDSTSLSFTIVNSNATTGLTGIAFSDTLPAGLVVATPNGLSGSCGGRAITATAGSNSISLSGAGLASGSSCIFSVNVTGTTAGAKSNTTTNVSSSNGGTGNTASASISVLAPPTITSSFLPANIAQGGPTSLSFTLTNPAGNTAALTGVGFTDTLPAGLTVNNASATICGGGTVTLTAPTGISLSGGTINSNGQCIFSIVVTGATAGAYTNTTGTISSTNGGTGLTASANLNVFAAPTVSGVSPSTGSIAGGTSITISGTNFTGATGVTIAGNACTSVVVVSATSITCTTPAGSLGSASVRVTNPGGTNAANTLFTYAVVLATSAVPTLSEWSMIAMASLIVLLASLRIRRRSQA